jgi:CheY-like chemotaxis protein
MPEAQYRPADPAQTAALGRNGTLDASHVPNGFDTVDRFFEPWHPMAIVLLVEDNDDVREMMALALQLGGGHTVWTAANGEQALELLKSGSRPNLILADLMMPVMNGWEFRDALMKDPDLSTIPVVVISAVTGELAHLGSTEYLSKPVDIDRLLDLVGEHCRPKDGSVLNGQARSPLQ